MSRRDDDVKSGEKTGDDEVADVDEDSCFVLQRPAFKKKKKKKPTLIHNPTIIVGMWIIDAAPADGNWATISSMIITNATSNAGLYMMGETMDVTGCPLHPDPRDVYYAGSVSDWEPKLVVPEVARCSGGSSGVRYRPKGGEDAGGEFFWIGGQMVGKGNDACVFVCVDLLLHGPIRPEGIQRLQDMGVFDRFLSGDSDALAPPRIRRQKHISLPPTEALTNKIHDNINQVTPTSSPDPVCGLRRQPYFSSDQPAADDDFDLFDAESVNIVSEADDDADMDDVDFVLRADFQNLDLDPNVEWCTLIQGSRVL